MSSAKPIPYVVAGVAGVAAVAIAVGAYAAGNSSSGNSGTATAAQGTPGRQLPPNGQGPLGFGTPVTGAAADKAKAAALAKYRGSVQQVMKLNDGSYVVHVITSSTEYHVLVSKDFKVMGADQGGPGAGGPPQGLAPQSGTAAPPGTTQ